MLAPAQRARATVCSAVMGCLLLRAAAAAHFSPGDILAITGGIYTNTSIALVVRPTPAQFTWRGIAIGTLALETLVPPKS